MVAVGEPTAAVVGYDFARAYYAVLSENPTKLHKFYKEQSVFSGSTARASLDETVTGEGPDDIQRKIIPFVGSYTKRSCKVELSSLSSQESSNGGVMVLVTGYFIYKHSQQRQHFSQAFFLDRQTSPNGYYVLNDILRYLEDPVESVPAPEVPKASEPVPRDSPAEGGFEEPEAEANVDASDEVAAADVGEDESVGHDASAENAYVEREAEMDEVVEQDDEQEQDHEEHYAEAEVAAQDDEADEEDVDAAAASASMEAQPKTWASMAGRLRQGPNQLGPSKVTGYARPAGVEELVGGKQQGVDSGKAGRRGKSAKGGKGSPVLPPPGSTGATAAAASTGAAEVGLPAPVLPPPSSVTGGAADAGKGKSSRKGGGKAGGKNRGRNDKGGGDFVERERGGKASSS
eukprot:TRINITY_DN64265_c0_g1_i1.p1 TRINITY_DN64265_c0_g1~~TRINITY_DN64265_c0_g1_i1.p1  ORF type:complete len:403 (-),score=117.74 TRINITY_DN64265_c0_g1_i1:77-1285(-)